MSEHRRKGPSRFGRSLALGLVTAAIFLGLILGGAAWAGWTVTNNGLSLPKLRLDGILLGSMTEEEMTQALRDAGWDRRTELPLTVHFPLGLSMTLSRLDANAAVPAEDAARELMKLGHGTDWFENLSKYLRATFSSGYDVVLRTGGLNENYIRANLRSVTERFDALTGDPDLHLDTDNARLTMTKGGGALSLNGDRIFAFVSDALRGDTEEVSWTEMDGDVRLPDFNRVAADLCVEAFAVVRCERCQGIAGFGHLGLAVKALTELERSGRIEQSGVLAVREDSRVLKVRDGQDVAGLESAAQDCRVIRVMSSGFSCD